MTIVVGDDARIAGDSSIVGFNVSSEGRGGEEGFAVFFFTACRRCRVGAGVGVEEPDGGRWACLSNLCCRVRRDFGLPVLVV